jgi:glycosyltransferase involved in cell wall biosynthesis
MKLADVFERSGSRFEPNKWQEAVVTPDFVRCFDLVIVVHDIFFIARNWEALSQRPVIWRTIGQAIESLDELVKPYREQGLLIVRWSPAERRLPLYAGHDAFIRGYKFPEQYAEWTGGQPGYIITFCSALVERYPNEYSFFEASVEGLECVVGGSNSKELCPQAVGIVNEEVQRKLLREASAYFYCHGAEVPYTLNFIEAWMMGIPIVAISKSVVSKHKNTAYYEVDELIEHGVDGYIVDSVDEAKSCLSHLIESAETARRVGAAGRRKAVQLFGFAEAAARWQALIGSVVSRSSTAAAEVLP